MTANTALAEGARQLCTSSKESLRPENHLRPAVIIKSRSIEEYLAVVHSLYITMQNDDAWKFARCHIPLFATGLTDCASCTIPRRAESLSLLQSLMIPHAGTISCHESGGAKFRIRVQPTTAMLLLLKVRRDCRIQVSHTMQIYHDEATTSCAK